MLEIASPSFASLFFPLLGEQSYTNHISNERDGNAACVLHVHVFHVLHVHVLHVYVLHVHVLHQGGIPPSKAAKGQLSSWLVVPDETLT